MVMIIYFSNHKAFIRYKFVYFQYIKSSYKSDRIKFEAKINTLENAVARQKELREEEDMKAELIFKQYKEQMQNNDLKHAKLEKENDNLKTIGNGLAKKRVSKIPV